MPVVVSGLDNGRGTGGVFVIDDRVARAVDDIPTSGMWFDERSGRWVRALHPVFSPVIDGSLLIYGRRGQVRLRRLRGARDLHDVRIIRGQTLVVASHENAVFISRRLGRLKPVWELPGEPDSWHLNCLALHTDELFASAFCDGGRYREWTERNVGTGIVFSVISGRVVARNLTAPHSPLFVDGNVVVCNSGTGELVATSPDSPARRLHAVQLGGWTRGLAVIGNRIWVGVSGDRHDQTASCESSVYLLDRSTWEVIGRIVLPVPEIYDIRGVPRHAVRMLDAGAEQARALVRAAAARRRRTPPLPGYAAGRRTASRNGDVLEPSHVRLTVVTKLPRRIQAGSLNEIKARFENRSSWTYPAAGEHAVHASYKWASETGDHERQEHEPVRTLLPQDLDAGGAVDMVVLVRAPTTPGRYRLRITLVQERVFWFDQVDPAASASGQVTVGLRAGRIHRARGKRAPNHRG